MTNQALLAMWPGGHNQALSYLEGRGFSEAGRHLIHPLKWRELDPLDKSALEYLCVFFGYLYEETK